MNFYTRTITKERINMQLYADFYSALSAGSSYMKYVRDYSSKVEIYHIQRYNNNKEYLLTTLVK